MGEIMRGIRSRTGARLPNMRGLIVFGGGGLRSGLFGLRRVREGTFSLVKLARCMVERECRMVSCVDLV
jgi:hypothetical protein